MRIAVRGSYNGIEFEIPANNDGRWTFVLRWGKRGRGQPQLRALPRPEFATPELAVNAARSAIDDFLTRMPPGSRRARAQAQSLSAN
jgi:hypothetical protein